jgi:hypothetical protein
MTVPIAMIPPRSPIGTQFDVYITVDPIVP